MARKLQLPINMRKFAGIVSFAVLAAVSSAAPMAWVLNTNTTIHAVNAATNNEALVGGTPWTSNSLARNPAGTLYSASPNGVICNVTGPPIPLAPTGRTQIADLDWDNGGLWGFDNGTKELFFFDLTSWTVTYSQVIAVNPNITFRGVARQSSTGNTYLCGNNGLNNDFLMMVPNLGIAAVPIGAMANGDAFSYFADIDFDASGNLYAMSFFHRWFYTVNTANGATTFVSAGPHRDTTAMALDSVPEPTTVAALALGIVAIKRRKRK